MKNIIDIFNEEIIVFKIKQDSQIECNTADHGEARPKLCAFGRRYFCEQKAQKVIYADACQNDSQIIRIKVTVKPQRHAG